MDKTDNFSKSSDSYFCNNGAPDILEFPLCSTSSTAADLEDGIVKRLLPGDINILAKDYTRKCMPKIEPCYACNWEREEHDVNESCDYSHFCPELPERYECTKHEQLIASLNPLELLEICDSIASNIPWCISYLNKQWQDSD